MADEREILEHRVALLERQARVYRKILDRDEDGDYFECNLCGFYGPFERFGNHKRANARCPVCSGLERSRLLAKALKWIRRPQPGDQVLELAPFKGTADFFRYRLNANFTGVDIDADKMIKQGIPCLQCDLCTPAVSDLGSFDVIINIHVMEHLRCNPLEVIKLLTGLLKPGGVHIISVPFGGAETEEDLSDMPDDVRNRRFGHPQHYRSFGHEQLPRDLKAMFGDRFGEFDRERLRTKENVKHSLGLDMMANRMFYIRGPRPPKVPASPTQLIPASE